MNTFKKGFTLIELLVVMGILSILATGLIIAINPVEQLHKSSDSAAESVARDLQSAVTRYYTAYSYMPWCGGSVSCSSDPLSAVSVGSSGATATINAMITAGELKTNYLSSLSDDEKNNVYVSGNNGSGTAVVCFKVTSKAMSSGTNLYTTSDGSGSPGACVLSGLGSCYICFK